MTRKETNIFIIINKVLDNVPKREYNCLQQPKTKH